MLIATLPLKLKKKKSYKIFQKSNKFSISKKILLIFKKKKLKVLRKNFKLFKRKLQI